MDPSMTEGLYRKSKRSRRARQFLDQLETLDLQSSAWLRRDRVSIPCRPPSSSATRVLPSDTSHIRTSHRHCVCPILAKPTIEFRVTARLLKPHRSCTVNCSRNASIHLDSTFPLFVRTARILLSPSFHRRSSPGRGDGDAPARA